MYVTRIHHAMMPATSTVRLSRSAMTNALCASRSVYHHQRFTTVSSIRDEIRGKEIFPKPETGGAIKKTEAAWPHPA